MESDIPQMPEALLSTIKLTEPNQSLSLSVPETQFPNLEQGSCSDCQERGVNMGLSLEQFSA